MRDFRETIVLWSMLAGWLLAGVSWIGGCGSSAEQRDADAERAGPIEQGRRFVRERAFRRQVLVDSLENPENLYSQRRLKHYAKATTGGAGAESWEGLPVRRPEATSVRVEDLGSFDKRGRRSRKRRQAGPAPSEWRAAWTHDGLMELGRRAFFRYPMRADARLAPAAVDRASARQVGLWVDAEGRVGGLVAETFEDGSERLAWTCATCHASVRVPGGPVVAGRSNAGLKVSELYRLSDRGSEDRGYGELPASDWRPGQVDSSRDGVENPTAIPDLRPIRYQSHLHTAATVDNSLMALAARVETLLIVSQAARARPPRQMAFAIAYYLWNLPLPDRSAQPQRDDDATSNQLELLNEGRRVFESTCNRCHRADGRVALPMDYRLVGTDPAAARSPARRTGDGRYRIPSLAGVADRPFLLHDASVRSLEAFLEPTPERRALGHPFGLELSAERRRALLAFLKTLPVEN